MTAADWNLDRSFSSSSGEIRWTSLGPADAPPVVLVHGTPFSSYVWREPARALARQHRVHVWDLPGYGVSETGPGQDLSLDAQARVLTELLDHWGLTGGSPEQLPTVVGHDFGGCVALRAHLVHGAAYARLALVDPVAVRPWGSPTYRLLGTHSDVFRQLPPDLHEALVHRYIASGSHRGLHPETHARVVAPWLTEAGKDSFYRQIAQNPPHDGTDDIQDRYGELDLPVLVCWGAEDTWIPVARAHELAKLIPGAELRIIEGAGHLVQEDAPAELAAVLGEFLRP
ncbi:alpha/beta fold hydrolase [Streptomyces fractus]|uniref:alpha/beta fold hydrolase n=1 Tax=Streptomyces fractus TaxID=641806 RepID=UPI003CECF0D2